MTMRKTATTVALTLSCLVRSGRACRPSIRLSPSASAVPRSCTINAGRVRASLAVHRIGGGHWTTIYTLRGETVRNMSVRRAGTGEIGAK